MLLNIKQYAKECGVNLLTIYNRLNKGHIKYTERKLPDGTIGQFIDSKKYPPVRLRKSGGGRKPKGATANLE